MERKPFRYAHNRGHTDVCFSLDGEKIITCGSDGDIRIWTHLEDVDPVQTCIGEWALCVRQKNEHLYIATDNYTVQLVTFPEGQRDGILCRFTAHVNHIAVHKELNLIAVVAEDMEVRVMDLEDKEKILSFSGLSGPPLSVALCPEGKLLAVSAGDGFLRVWEVETQKLIKQYNCVPKVNSFLNAKCLGRMDFHPSTDIHQLAFPSESSVVVVNTLDWSEKIKLSCGSVKSQYSLVQYSPCGNLIAAATLQGEIVVWNSSLETVLGFTIHPSYIAVCAMAWDPKGNGSIVLCDIHGQISEVTNCKGIEDKDASKDTATVEELLDDIENYKEPSDSEDEDNENVISLKKIKEDVMGPNSESDCDQISLPHSETPRPRTPEIQMQPVFMPTSTPLHLNPRYLCWNEIGVVKSYTNVIDDDADVNGSIEVEFHDASFHNSIMLSNFQNYTMASLSSSCLAIANANQISVIPLNSAAKEWQMSVPEEEEVLGIAASSKLIAVVTNNCLVRICTIFGIQRGITAVPGRLLTLTARENNVLIAYHAASLCVNLIWIKFIRSKLRSTDLQSALTPDTTLLYLGFTDVGTPALQNSSGLLYLYPEKCNTWIPVCDTTNKTALADGFFITAVDEQAQSVRGVRCRGSIYPTFVPRPVLSELPLIPPFAEMHTEKSQLEANLFVWSCLQVENVERRYKETALKSFALACKSNLDQRALELVEMLGDSQVLNLAVKYASKMNNKRLAEKLAILGSSLMEDSDEENVDMSLTFNTPIRREPIKSTERLSFRSTNSAQIKLQTKVSQKSSPKVEAIKPSSVTAPVDSQESVFDESNDSKPSPFAKRFKPTGENISKNGNPLDMSDTSAGLTYDSKKKKGTETEKRKLEDADPLNQKEKQRKLDLFMFKKSS